MKSNRLEGKVAVITGAASGLCQGIAKEFADNGAIIAVADMDEKGAEKTLKMIEELGGKGFFVKINIGDTDSVNAAIKEVVDKEGRIDILINGAAISRYHQLQECSDEEWNLMINVDLTGTFRTMRAAFPYLCESKGHIVNISSTSGKSGGGWSGAHYVASKAGVIGLARYAAKEWAKFGIIANAICPGVADTPLTADADQGRTGAMLKAIPLGRKALPSDIAQVALFLCETEYCTGITVDCTGGRYIYNN